MTLSLGNYFSFGPEITLPLFTGGKIRSNVALQDARVTEALVSYQAIILTALEETENALSAYGNEQERSDRLAAAVQSNETAFELVNVQYRAGLTDFLTVLDALRELHAGQDLLAGSRTAVMKDLVTLFRALGGGWEIAPDM
jgi:outer membrane protein TolC